MSDLRERLASAQRAIEELEREKARLRGWQKEAAEILPMPSDYWTAEEGEFFRLRRAALLKALAQQEGE